MLVQITERGELIQVINKVDRMILKDNILTINGSNLDATLDVQDTYDYTIFKEDESEELRYYIVRKNGVVNSVYHWQYSESADKNISVNKQELLSSRIRDNATNIYSYYFINY